MHQDEKNCPSNACFTGMPTAFFCRCARPTVIAFAAALLAATPVSADDLPTLPSLRHIVFDFVLSATQLTEAYDSGEGIDSPSNGNSGTAAQNGKYVAGNRRSGSVVIDVVAATGDGGLVADVREIGEGQRTAAVRCAVARDGSVTFDPRGSVNDEAQLALRYLARGFFAPSKLEPGGAWSIDRHESGFRERMTYRIEALRDEVHVSIGFDGTRSVSGARFLESTEHGTIQYDRTLLVPLSIVVKTRTLETNGTHRRSADEAIDVRLRSDGFTSS